MTLNLTDAFARLLRLLLALGLLLAAEAAGSLPSTSRGATFTWNNAPANNQWVTPGNWTPAGVPGSNDAVQFTVISTSPGISLAGPRTVQTVQFGGLSNYSLIGGSLTVTGGSVGTNGLVAPTSYTIAVPLALTAETNFSPGDQSTLSISQGVTDNALFQHRKIGAGTLALTGGISSVYKLRIDAGALDINGGVLALRAPDSVAWKSSARIRGGGKVTMSANGAVLIGGVSSPTISVEGADAEIRNARIGVGDGFDRTGGALDVSAGGLVEATTFDIHTVGPNTVNVRTGGQIKSTVATIGSNIAINNDQAFATVTDAGSLWQTDELAIGNFTGGGHLTVSNGGAFTVARATQLDDPRSTLVVNGGVFTTGWLSDFGPIAPIQLTNPADGAALVITSPDASFVGTLTTPLADGPGGVGGLRKSGLGTQILAGRNTFTGGTLVTGGVLKLAVGDSLAPTGAVEVAGGTFDLGGHSQHIGDFKLTSGTLAGVAGSTLVAGNVDVFAGTIATPLTTAAAVTKHGAGTTTASAPITADAIVVVGGVFDAQGGVKANVNTAAGAQLKLRGTLEGNLFGASGSTTTLTGATVVTGSVADGGLVDVGAHTLALSGAADPAIAAITLTGGVVTSTGVVTLSSSLSGSGVVVARVGSVPAIPPASIRALGGPLVVGTMTAADSLNGYLGSLTAGVQQLTLLSSGFTTLGNAATVNGGTINSINGVQVNPAKSLTGFGVVSGPLKNLGVVTGGAGANVLRLTGPVTGDGSFQGNVQFEHTYSPGASPAAVSFLGDPVFASTSRLEIEIGGRTPGAEHDRLDVGGKLTLGGVLRVALVDGFTPVAGDAFDILDWTTLDGAFAALELPALPGLRWDVSQLYDSGSLAVAPLYEADFDSNGRVDAADLALWRAGFNKSNAGRADGDATGDQLVSGEDFLVWQRQLGLGVASLPATTAVPEPASALVLAGAIAGLIARRRSR